MDSENKVTSNIGSISHEDKKGSMLPIVIIMFISLFIAFAWDKFPIIKNSVHAVLTPTAGALLRLNIPGGLEIGMIIIVLLITLLSTLVQKFATDQKALKELKKEQKILSEEMK